jgi:hypothetical protein
MKPDETPVPRVRSPRIHLLLRVLAAATLGALGFTIIGQIMARTGGSCGLLCNPMASIPMGILVGVLSVGLGRGD